MKDLVVIARNAPEMAVAQQGLVKWAQEKMAEAGGDRDQLQGNLDLAKKAGWRTDGLVRAVRLATKQVEFYEKIERALAAGYVIVPNFPIDVFAIRTRREDPVGSVQEYRGATHTQESEAPPAGEGRYVSPEPAIGHEEVAVDRDGKQVKVLRTWPEEFRDVLFPFSAVKPQIVKDTAEAMQKAIFDEIGIAPQGRKKDPMTIGRIFYRGAGPSWNRREVSFLISWWLTNRDLELRRLV